MADFFRDQERWLNPYARLGQSRARQYRRGRNGLAVDALPKPDLETAPRHVLLVWQREVLPSLVVETWRRSRELVRQQQWWYDALAVFVAQTVVVGHVETCQACQEDIEPWDFILTAPMRTPRGKTWDLDGNIKPTKEEA